MSRQKRLGKKGKDVYRSARAPESRRLLKAAKALRELRMRGFRLFDLTDFIGD